METEVHTPRRVGAESEVLTRGKGSGKLERAYVR